MRTLRKLLANFMRRYRHRPQWSFCWRVALEGVGVSVLVAIPLAVFGFDRKIETPIAQFAVFAVCVAPWFETLLLQSLPIGIARLCGAGSGVQALSSIVPFFLLHAIEGVTAGLAAGMIGGLYFAFTYIRWRRVGWWSAFWVTTVSHGIRNLLAVFAMLASR